MTPSVKTTQLMHSDYSDVFTGIWCFKGTFLSKIKNDVNLYQVELRHVVCTLHEPFIKEKERLQELQILAPLRVDEKAE